MLVRTYTKIKKSVQISRFVVLTGPTADEILKLHKAHGFGPACDKIFVLQFGKFGS